MTGRELLEKAARAAKLRVGPYPSAGGSLWDESDPSNHKLWNPLEDDGDALRLAVKLNLLDEHPGFTFELAVQMGATDDPYAATRRAIVRAAAAIGDAG